MSRVDVGEEAGDSDRLGLGELEAVGDATRKSGTRGRCRAARLSTTTAAAGLAFPETGRRRFSDRRIASTPNTAPRRYR